MPFCNSRAGRWLGGLGRDTRAVALIEFAYAFPILLTLSFSGAELANYIVTRLRISQLALHIADNASRIGTGQQLQVKTINETDINDLFMGAEFQSRELKLKDRGRVILSSLEPMAYPNVTKKFKIRWQRCMGNAAYTRSYGTAGATNLDGMGDADRLVTAPERGSTMFVELHYRYKPLIDFELLPEVHLVEHASMMVRDTRDTTGGNNGVYPVAGETPSTC